MASHRCQETTVGALHIARNPISTSSSRFRDAPSYQQLRGMHHEQMMNAIALRLVLNPS